MDFFEIVTLDYECYWNYYYMEFEILQTLVWFGYLQWVHLFASSILAVINRHMACYRGTTPITQEYNFVTPCRPISH